MQDLIFETSYLLVRKLKMSDIDPYHEMQSNPKVMQYVVGKVQSKEAHLKEIDHLRELYQKEDNDFWIYAVERKSDYRNTAQQMETLAAYQEGYLGIESTQDELGITVSYWKDLKSRQNWKNNLEHSNAREKGRERWYKQYQLQICKVEREYGFTNPNTNDH